MDGGVRPPPAAGAREVGTVALTPAPRGTIDGVEDENGWLKLTRADPDHSQWYIDRFRSMAAQGVDLGGEARLIDAMVARGSRVLDAGCGAGRVGAFLAAAGHEVVGVDLDPVLIDAARSDHPGPQWLVGDLATLDLPARGIADGFDAIVCAGNVMAFLAPATRREVLRRMRRHLRDGGRAVVGFGAGRGYEFDEFLSDAGEVGLVADVLLSTWDLRPFTEGSDFLVAVLRPAALDDPSGGTG
jgi:SAM-dependent methyltransferase